MEIKGIKTSGFDAPSFSKEKRLTEMTKSAG